jgi:nucleoside-diphosphate-sugar epimerase
MGDKYRVANIDRLKAFGFTPNVILSDGIKETIEWYINNSKIQRYDVFKE